MLAALLLSTLIAAAATPAPRPGEPLDEQVRQNSLVAEFAVPLDTGRHPAVLVLGGFTGGIPTEAYGLAQQGYAGLAVAYFGAGPLANAPDQVPVELVSRALDYLAARAEVDPTRIGIVGVSKGAELALLAAARDPRVKSVAVISPTPYVWFAPEFDGSADRSSWTLNGAPLPFVPVDHRAEELLGQAYQSNGTFAFRDLYVASLAAAPAPAVAAATIPVDRIAAPLLCVAGDDDQYWDSASACKTIAARRHAAGKDARDQVDIEPGVGHQIGLGGHPSPVSIPAGRMTVRLGGTVAANVRGAADAWTRTLTFFARTL